MKPIKFLPVIAVASLLGACAAPTPHDLNMAEVRMLPQMGTAFDKALHQDYAALAQTEIDEGHRDATTFYNMRARQAAAGHKVMPTQIGDRELPASTVAELTQARANLMRVLDAGGATRAATDTARAQTQFDCWIEEQEENFQPKDIAECRQGFVNAMNQANKVVFAEAKPAPAAKVAAKTAMPSSKVFTVLFDHNSDRLNTAAMSVNNEIIAHIKSTRAKSVTVNGYTDRSGTQEYNHLLAERRARAVANMLENSGIEPKVGEQSFGENRPAVQTADDVREWHNRRVLVTVRQ